MTKRRPRTQVVQRQSPGPAGSSTGAVPATQVIPPQNPAAQPVAFGSNTYPALDVVLIEMKERLARLDGQNTALEGKATYVLTAATLLLTTVGGAQTALTARGTRYYLSVGRDSILARGLVQGWPQLHPDLPLYSFTLDDVLHVAALVAAAIYVWIVSNAWRAYNVHVFKDIQASQLKKYLPYETYAAKTVLVDAMEVRFAANDYLVARKGQAVRRALAGLFAEVLFLVLFFLMVAFVL